MTHDALSNFLPLLSIDVHAVDVFSQQLSLVSRLCPVLSSLNGSAQMRISWKVRCLLHKQPDWNHPEYKTLRAKRETTLLSDESKTDPFGRIPSIMFTELLIAG